MPVNRTDRALSQNKNRKPLNIAGLRNTTQRALIMDIFRRGQGHMDADEIYLQAKRELPRISLATIYRTLQKLTKQGLIEELHFDEMHHHYGTILPTEHHHMICFSCGKVIDFEYPLAHLIKRKATEAEDFEITDIEIKFTGYCSDCKESKK